jgi:hypothetical protein
MASLIASGTTAEDSSDFTVVAGTPVTIFLHDAAGPNVPGDCTAAIQVKSSGSQYFTVGVLDGNNPARVITGPGTYRVSKFASATAFGVDKE